MAHNSAFFIRYDTLYREKNFHCNLQMNDNDFMGSPFAQNTISYYTDYQYINKSFVN